MNQGLAERNVQCAGTRTGNLEMQDVLVVSQRVYGALGEGNRAVQERG